VVRQEPAFTDAQNLDQLRQSLGLAIDLYRARGWSTPFALYAGTYAEQQVRGADLGLVPLVACYAPRCSTAPSSMRSAAPTASPSPT